MLPKVVKTREPSIAVALERPLPGVFSAEKLAKEQRFDNWSVYEPDMTS
jgi:hypothetical protein